MSEDSKTKTSTGLEQNIAGLLCYVFGFVTGVIFLVIEKENKFVKFHAIQSIFTYAALFIINIVLGFIPILGWVGNIILVPFSLILWVILMVKAYKGEWYKLPVIGDISMKQIKGSD